MCCVFALFYDTISAMHKIDAHMSEVRSRLLATGLKPSRLAILAGLSPMGLRHLQAETWSCSVTTLRRLEDLLCRLEQDPSKTTDDQAAA